MSDTPNARFGALPIGTAFKIPGTSGIKVTIEPTIGPNSGRTMNARETITGLLYSYPDHEAVVVGFYVNEAARQDWGINGL